LFNPIFFTFYISIYFSFQYIFSDIQLSNEIDWRHLSNIVHAYDTYCLETFIQQRETKIFNRTSQILDEQSTNKYPTTLTTLTTSIILGISSFFNSLPAYYSLSRITRNYLFKTNIRPLIFPNIHELNQSCFSEPWQVKYKHILCIEISTRSYFLDSCLQIDVGIYVWSTII
jgi:hypothetical protein